MTGECAKSEMTLAMWKHASRSAIRECEGGPMKRAETAKREIGPGRASLEGGSGRCAPIDGKGAGSQGGHGFQEEYP